MDNEARKPTAARRRRGGRVLDVPFYRQESPVTCGPASLRMALEHLGIDLPELALTRLSGADLFGTSSEGLVEAASMLGLKGEVIEARPAPELEEWLSSGLPLLALLDAGELYDAGSPTHWVVVVGMENLEVVYHDPDPCGGPARRARYERFWRAWLGGRYFGVKIWKPENE